jgi:uncharacterized damage-inducible protein DinB
MTRKEILIFQLREARNEFLDALADLTQEQLTARPIEGRNPIGWIVCHCLHNFNFFIHQRQTNRSLMTADGEYGRFAKYGWDPPTEQNPPPDFTGLSDAVGEVFGVCIELIEALDEEVLSNLSPYWHHKNFESTSGNCVRVINHSNTHLRQIWLLRGALGDKDHWPVQTLYKKPDEERGRFYVPDRETILADRAR